MKPKIIIALLALSAAAFAQNKLTINPLTGLPDLVGPTNPSISVAPYTQTVTAQTSVTILAATHGFGTLATYSCWDNATPRNYVACAASRNSSGDLVFSFSPAFTGLLQVGSPTSTVAGGMSWPAAPGITVCTGTPCTAWGTSLGTGTSGHVLGFLDGAMTLSGTAAGVGSLLLSNAPVATNAYGLINFGPGPWDHTTTGFFAGSSNGTGIAMNLAAGSTADLMNLQVGGVSKASLTSAGNLSVAGTGTFGGGTTPTVSSVVVAAGEPGPGYDYSQLLIDASGSSGTTAGAAIGLRGKSTGTQQDWFFGVGTGTSNNNFRLYDVTNSKDMLNVAPSTGAITLYNLKTTGAATGKTVVCVDTTTGQLYASTSGVACAN